MNLRRRVGLASRGHRLLSEKRDELSRQLIQAAGEIMSLRKEVEEKLLQTCRRFMLARSSMEPEAVQAALEIPTKKFKLIIEFANVMNVQVPELSSQMEGDIFCYGFATTSGELDVALLSLEKVFDKLIELAKMEQKARLIASELEKTRRRVNVLEYIIIPEMQETMKYIVDKLTEAERDNITRLMKVADMIRE